MNILMIDDQQLNNLFITEILSDGFFITNCSSAARALEYVFNDKYHFDTIILNMISPNAISLLNQLTSKKSRVPVIVITPSERPEDLTEAFNNGAYDYITKPFIHDIVLERVTNSCRQYQRYCQLMEESDSLKNEDLDPKLRLFNYNTTKWLIDERIKHSDSHTLIYIKVTDLDQLAQKEGNHASEYALVKIASFLMTQFQKDNILGAVGYGEIIVYIDDALPEEDSIEKLKELLRVYYGKFKETIIEEITLEIGYAKGNDDFETLLKNARENIIIR